MRLVHATQTLSVRNFAEQGWVFSRCCGMAPARISVIAEAANGAKPRISRKLKERPMQKTSFDTIISAMQQTLLAADNDYKIWRLLDTGHNGKEVILLNNPYSTITEAYAAFFLETKRALFASMITNLYILFETRNNTHNIPRLLKRIESDKRLPQNIITSLNKKYEELKTTWRKIGRLRNQLISHISSEKKPEEIFKEAKLTYGKIEEFIKETMTLLNCSTSNIKNSTHLFNNFSVVATTRLLKDLDNMYSSRCKTLDAQMQ